MRNFVSADHNARVAPSQLALAALLAARGEAGGGGQAGVEMTILRR